MAKSGTLSNSERNILTALRHFAEPVTPTQISLATGLSYSTVQHGLRVLMASGLVRRVGHGKYTLTDKGREAVQQAVQ